MGMFDYIKYKDKEYQSKDLDCMLEYYEITNNRLIKTTRSADGWMIEYPDIDMNLHGYLNLIGGSPCSGEGFEKVRLKFTDGTLVEETSGFYKCGRLIEEIIIDISESSPTLIN